jgi:hypothetical protein
LEISPPGSRNGASIELASDYDYLRIQFNEAMLDDVVVLDDEGLFVLPIALPNIGYQAEYSKDGVTLVDPNSGDPAAVLSDQALDFHIPGVLPTPIPYPTASFTHDGVALLDSASGDPAAMFSDQALNFHIPGALPVPIPYPTASFTHDGVALLDSATGDSSALLTDDGLVLYDLGAGKGTAAAEITRDHIKLSSGAQLGYVLTSNENGIGQWQAPPFLPGEGWVDDGTVLRLANANDSVGIGTHEPIAKLHVFGDIVGVGTITSADIAPFGRKSTVDEKGITMATPITLPKDGRQDEYVYSHYSADQIVLVDSASGDSTLLVAAAGDSSEIIISETGTEAAQATLNPRSLIRCGAGHIRA